MMPASRAACSGSPFLTAPLRISRSASRDIVIDPRAIASRSVTGLSPTSTIFTRPRASTCDSVVPSGSRLPVPPVLPCPTCSSPSPCARKNDRLSSDTVRSTLFSFTSGGTCSVPGEKFSTALMPGGDDQVERRAARDGAGTAITAMRMPSRRATFFRSWMSWIGTPPRDCWPTFSLQVVEQRRDLEALLAEAGIVGEREAEVAGAHDRDAQLAIEAEDLAQVPLQIADVVADAADAELAEVGEVLADLRGVQVELLGERLRRDRLHAGAPRARSGSGGRPKAGWW